MSRDWPSRTGIPHDDLKRPGSALSEDPLEGMSKQGPALLLGITIGHLRRRLSERPRHGGPSPAVPGARSNGAGRARWRIRSATPAWLPRRSRGHSRHGSAAEGRPCLLIPRGWVVRPRRFERFAPSGVSARELPSAVNEIEVGFGSALRVKALLEPGYREPAGVNRVSHLGVGRQ